MTKKSSLRKRWKNWEYWLADYFEGRRAGAVGSEGPDIVETPYPLSIEAKSRKHLPKWVLDAIMQAASSAIPDTVPVVIWHIVGDRGGNAIVTLYLYDFEEIMRRLREQKPGEEGRASTGASISELPRSDQTES